VCLHALILFLSFFVLQGARMYLVCVSHVGLCVFAGVFYVFMTAIWRNK